ncbi:Bardet-Biedl syndrome 1 protein-like protein [Leptotrombidium deliense]|uniref:Bardet-Biedl syndrome 1 protein-like protein n=1 Tax=Leptotrombidium deliense TaxID=299467 RepID=A0A443SQW6_9ACAR|nr:Bardet-Biedl syndrome 1 protein-like protein [Leptotrombidium deliense]
MSSISSTSTSNKKPQVSHPSDTTTTTNSQSTSKWLLAHQDTLACLYTFSSCITFADLQGDGDYKLIIADLGTVLNAMKLNVYRGTFLQAQLTLVDIPAGILAFHMDTLDPQVPAIAVASGAYLYIYKNLKPFYKFALPELPVNETENDAWMQIKEEKIDCLSLKQTLETLRLEIGEVGLTPRSQKFLSLSNAQEMEAFVSSQENQTLRRLQIITCVASIKKTVDDEKAISCFILGTENKDIFIIEPDAFTVLCSVKLPSVPVFIEVNGLFDVEYRLIVTCRDAHIYTIKRGFKTGRLCVQLNSQPVGLLRINNNIIVGCMDCSLSAYTPKGNCIWTVKQPAQITALAALDIDILGVRLIAVALENQQIHIYNDKNKVDVIEIEDVVTSIKFGRYGREDNTLVMVTRKGWLVIKILKRTAKFFTKDTNAEAVFQVAYAGKLNIPKKTKLFVDETMREREESISQLTINPSLMNCFFLDIHRTFQQDLYRLRLTTTRAFVKAITASLNPISANIADPLKLSAQIHGLGPTFRLILELQNTSVDQPSLNLFLTFQCDVRIYKIDRNYIPVPFLSPGFIYTFATKVECVSELNVNDVIKVFVVREEEVTPLITAVINMPASEAPV